MGVSREDPVPDWCLLLNDLHVAKLGGLPELTQRAYSVTDVPTPSGHMFLAQATKTISEMATDHELPNPGSKTSDLFSGNSR